MTLGAPSTPGMEPFDELARAGDWRALVEHGRFALAARTLRLAGGTEVDPALEDALSGLAEVEAAVRSKAPGRARRALARLEARPEGLVDWAALDADLVTLEAATEAADKREPQVARAALDALRLAAFTAEREVLRGTLAVFDGDAATATGHFEAALALDPNHVRAWTNRGNVRLEAGDVDGAIADYEQALRLDDGFANAHHNLGVAFRRKGQIGKSVAALRKAQRHAARRDAESARAGLRDRRAGRAPRTGTPWRRWLWIAAGAAVVLWFLQQRGTI